MGCRWRRLPAGDVTEAVICVATPLDFSFGQTTSDERRMLDGRQAEQDQTAVHPKIRRDAVELVPSTARSIAEITGGLGIYDSSLRQLGSSRTTSTVARARS
jgi:hypothetical protein